MWYTHTMECYLVIKRNEVWRHATAWLYLENTMLSKLSQPQKLHILRLRVYDMSRVGKHTETESR